MLQRAFRGALTANPATAEAHLFLFPLVPSHAPISAEFSYKQVWHAIPSVFLSEGDFSFFIYFHKNVLIANLHNLNVSKLRF